MSYPNHVQAVKMAKAMHIKVKRGMETSEIVWEVRKKLQRDRCAWTTLSVLKTSEGGPGYAAIEWLRDAGVYARRAPSWCGSTSGYVGHVGIEVPTRFQLRACRIVWR